MALSDRWLEYFELRDLHGPDEEMAYLVDHLVTEDLRRRPQQRPWLPSDGLR